MLQEPLPPDLDQELRFELTTGERLLWSGRPNRGIILRVSDWFSLLFGIFWLGFVIFWMWGAASSGAPIFFILFGVPFFLVGLFLVGGRFILDAFQKRKMVYAVTSQRVLILQGVINRSVRSINLRALPEILLSVRSNGSGSILFGQASPYGQAYRSMGWMGMPGMTAFENIPNVRQVHEIILRAQREAGDYSSDQVQRGQSQ